MPINSNHPDIALWAEKWKRCRDVIEGSDAVKAAGEDYLPKLDSHHGSAAGEAAYEAYKLRALFFNATSRTIDGLTGSVFRKDPDIEAPEVLNPVIEDATMDGVPLVSLMREAFTEALSIGSMGLLIDMPADASQEARPYLATYTAESIINWRLHSIGGVTRTSLVVLEETVEEDNAEDHYVVERVIQYRELLIKNGVYVQRVWRQHNGAYTIAEEHTPSVKGVPLSFIPFYFIGPDSPLTPKFGKPPLLDLVDVNLSHYRSAADLEHGRHYTALPTPWAAGFGFEDGHPLPLGPQSGWVSDEPTAQAGMLEFTGQGLQALQDALIDKQRMMAVIGSRMLEEQKKVNEAAETLQMRKGAEESVLQALARDVGRSFSVALTDMLLFFGVQPKPGEVTVKLNTDFLDAKISGQDMIALMGMYQGEAISFETLYDCLQRGEIARPGVTWEEELELIRAGAAQRAGSRRPEDADPGPDNPDDEDDEDDEDA